MESNIAKKSIKFKNKSEYLTSKEVCERFSGLVYDLCKRWTIRYDIEDLKQIGFIGLIKAYNAYDINKNVLFTTFATMIINSELNQNYRSDKSQHILITSLNTTISNNHDEGSEFIELLHDEINYEDIALTNIDCENLKLAIDRLEPVDKTIVELLAFQHKTQIEVSQILNIGCTSVYRRYKDSLSKIKNIMKGDDNMPIAKLSKEELLAHIKKYGTNKVALSDIAQKKGISLGTVKSYLDVWDIRKYSKDYRGNKDISNKIRAKETKNILVEEKPILQLVKLYKGSIGEYEIKENCVDLRFETGTLTIEKENINNLVIELQELSKLMV